MTPYVPELASDPVDVRRHQILISMLGLCVFGVLSCIIATGLYDHLTHSHTPRLSSALLIASVLSSIVILGYARIWQLPESSDITHYQIRRTDNRPILDGGNGQLPLTHSSAQELERLRVNEPNQLIAMQPWHPPEIAITAGLLAPIMPVNRTQKAALGA